MRKPNLKFLGYLEKEDGFKKLEGKVRNHACCYEQTYFM